jgi:2-phosphoglycerate kinase
MPPWTVLLIGGASGVGKTQVSYRLAQHFGVGITEIDDFHVILERMTTPEQYPEVHLFPTDPEAFFRLDEEGKLAFAIRYAEVMAEPLTSVIANHLDGGSPIVLEGDFLLPDLATQTSYDGISAAGKVRALFLYEEEDQIARNYLAREGEPQPGRARASWRHSEWLRQEANRLGVPTLAARPWETVFARALALLNAADPHGVRTKASGN